MVVPNKLRDVAEVAFEGEEWRDVPHVPGFKASNLGRIFGRMGRILPGSKNQGYTWTVVRMDGSLRHFSHHSMVMAAFVGPREPDMQIDHIDCNRSNNRLDNLRYVTAAENMARLRGPLSRLEAQRQRRKERSDAQRPEPWRTTQGATQRYAQLSGTLNGRALLTEEQVLEIRALERPSCRGRAGSKHPNAQRSIAQRYGVSVTAISDILSGKRWRHL